MEKLVNDLKIFKLSSRAAGLHPIGQMYRHAERETPFIVFWDTSIAHADIVRTIDFRYILQP